MADPAAPPDPDLRRLRCGGRSFDLGRRTYVMGIVNITPDSFSDGGRFLDATAAYDRAMRLLDDGADLVDLGAESTRPGAVAVDADEECRRLLPVVRRLVEAGVDCLSVDTAKASVAAAALDAGAAWINDVSGLADPGLAAVAARADAFVVMHARPMSAGRPEDDVRYDDLLREVATHLEGLCRRATGAGVHPDRLVIDPGIGFGKTVRDNLALLDGVATLRGLGHPVLVGPSRKRFVSVVAGVDPTDVAARDDATVGACCLAAVRGADFVRVHEVAAVRRALAVVDAAVRGDTGTA
jgi:dihydropteroate synthase